MLTRGGNLRQKSAWILSDRDGGADGEVCIDSPACPGDFFVMEFCACRRSAWRRCLMRAMLQIRIRHAAMARARLDYEGPISINDMLTDAADPGKASR